MRRFLTRFRRDEDGNSTVNFVLVFPLYFATVLTFFEAGWIMAQLAMLDRGVEVAVRDLRVGTQVDPTPNNIRTRICDASFLIRNCEEVTMIELTEIATAADYPTDGADCVDRTTPNDPLNPQDDFTPGARAEIMYMRVCILIDPWFPGLGLGFLLPKDSTGGVQMATATAFVNEPQ